MCGGVSTGRKSDIAMHIVVSFDKYGVRVCFVSDMGICLRSGSARVEVSCA